MDAERYDPQQVEPKWVAAWEEAALYRADEGDDSRPRFYALDMFPYPSRWPMCRSPDGYGNMSRA